jgi:hypothetical protein
VVAQHGSGHVTGRVEGQDCAPTGSHAGLMMAIKVRRLGGIVDGIVEYCTWRDFHRGQTVYMNRPSPLPFDPAGEVVLVIVAGLL